MTEMIQIPATFKYKDILFKGRPVHDKNSAFYAKHPPMPASRWAKIFAPFDALRGFNECIAEQEVLRTEKRILDEDSQRELDRKLEILKNLTWNNRMARANKVTAKVTYFQPSRTKGLGTYETVSGIVWKVDADLGRTIKVGEKVIDLDDILSIETDAESRLSSMLHEDPAGHRIPSIET